MARQIYLLELENWYSTDVVGRYRTLEEAKRHGVIEYPHNEWHIRDPAGAVIYEHDPYSLIMGQEQSRFQTTERWQQHYRDLADRQANLASLQAEAARTARFQALLARIERSEPLDWKKFGF